MSYASLRLYADDAVGHLEAALVKARALQALAREPHDLLTAEERNKALRMALRLEDDCVKAAYTAADLEKRAAELPVREAGSGGGEQ